MQKVDDVLDMIKISNFLRKEEEKENCRKICTICVIVFGVLILTAAAAYGIYKFVTRDEDDFDEDDFDEDDFEIFDEEEDDETMEE